MTILLNGQPHSLADSVTLAELLAGLGYATGFAVAVNREFVPRSRYVETTVRPGDEVEVLTPRQGG
jgi:sulfur carrier protein